MQQKKPTATGKGMKMVAGVSEGERERGEGGADTAERRKEVHISALPRHAKRR